MRSLIFSLLFIPTLVLADANCEAARKDAMKQVEENSKPEMVEHFRAICRRQLRGEVEKCVIQYIWYPMTIVSHTCAVESVKESQ